MVGCALSGQRAVTIPDPGELGRGLAAEDEIILTLRRAEAIDETILRQNIEQITGSGKSIMPEGLEQSIDPQQMSDLLVYLLAR